MLQSLSLIALHYLAYANTSEKMPVLLIILEKKQLFQQLPLNQYRILTLYQLLSLLIIVLPNQKKILGGLIHEKKLLYNSRVF